jgi:hypothetical protein
LKKEYIPIPDFRDTSYSDESPPHIIAILFFISSFGLSVFLFAYSLPLGYEGGKVLWPLAGEVHLFSRKGMPESQGLGMQGLTRTQGETVVDESLVFRCAFSTQYYGSPIPLVSEQWVPYVLHVGSYLVGAACLKATLDEGDIAEFLYHFPMGDSIFPDA